MAAIARSEAVRLFVERAQAANPSFTLSADVAPTIAAIVRRLDGLPLAIELAAARSRLLPPAALLTRLDQRLPLLTGGPRDAPQRHHTLHNTIAWSYDLLSAEDQKFFRTLAVFTGGFDLEAVAAVVTESDPFLALAGLEALVDQSLVQRLTEAGASPRFAMLETIRECSLERLTDSSEEESLRDAHAAWFLDLGERAYVESHGPAQADWLERLESDHPNLRGALARWLHANPPSERGVQLAGALWWFWRMRGHLVEGCGWLLKASAVRSEAAPRIRVLSGAGALAESQADLDRAIAFHQEALALARETHDQESVAKTLEALGQIDLDHGAYAEYP